MMMLLVLGLKLNVDCVRFSSTWTHWKLSQFQSKHYKNLKPKEEKKNLQQIYAM